MNINTSTGGPHLLLFERDQQFATLLTSELQLAGYTNHVARTAVEVFDAISRYPVRLVLVDLAQAAAARREFWVALDSQRRDRKVQVLTFVCTNLASYGPRDLEDHIQNANIDMEIDGMLGLLSLVDAVRTRVPSATIDTNTQPRMQRFSSQQVPAVPKQSMQMPLHGNTGSFPVQVPSDTGTLQAMHKSGSHFMPQTPLGSPIGQTTTNLNPQPSPATGLSGSNQPSYSEKIRAVLYPNQRNWSVQEGENSSTAYEMKTATNSALPAMHAASPIQQPAHTNNDAPMLQRLANGQLPHGENPQNESGLAQLSRLVQGFRSAPPLKENPSAYTAPTQQQQQPATQWQSAPTPQQPITQWQPAPSQQQPVTQWSSAPSQQQQPVTQWQPAPSQQQPVTQWPSAPSQQQQPITQWPSAPSQQQPSTQWQPASTTQWSTINVGSYSPQQPVEPMRDRGIEQNQANRQQNQVHTYSTFVIPTARTSQDEKIGAQPLRASPIQDMPLERTVSGSAITEQQKRPDVLSRSNYGQQVVTPSPQSATGHLASIATPMPPSNKGTMAPPATPEPTTEEPKQPEISYEQRQDEEPVSKVNGKDKIDLKTVANEEEKPVEQIQLPEDLAESMTTNNAVLLDIVQSLPPMPALGEQPQSIQAQALNGRATRSLNKVLLDGHLVPQDRLDVAQNIQRMLRGVDLNYQLGEILLMFKLLTPDQLLAASLVSYGLITTTQISALGRIRQELYAIGLEYDLENLLIVFRILTTEQLREARSSLQS
jgi:hypothetical protein